MYMYVYVYMYLHIYIYIYIYRTNLDCDNLERHFNFLGGSKFRGKVRTRCQVTIE